MWGARIQRFLRPPPEGGHMKNNPLTQFIGGHLGIHDWFELDGAGGSIYSLCLYIMLVCVYVCMYSCDCSVMFPSPNILTGRKDYTGAIYNVSQGGIRSFQSVWNISAWLCLSELGLL